MMLHEHDMGRKLLSGVRENLAKAGEGDASAQSAVRENASLYIELLRHHIWKEDNILFAMARQVLDESAAQQLAQQFAGIASEGLEAHRQFAAAQSA